MKRLAILTLTLFSIQLMAGTASENIVGFQKVSVPPGKSTFSIPMREVGNGKSVRLSVLLPFANIGDGVELSDGVAKVGISDDGKHWYLGGKVVDDRPIAPGSSVVYWNSGEKAIEFEFSGEVGVGMGDAGKGNGQDKPIESRGQKKPEIKTSQPQMMMSDVLSYSTVQLMSLVGNGMMRTGTGFFYYCQRGKYGVPVIITNRHVIDSVQRTRFDFTVAKDGRPTEKMIPYETDYRGIKWIAHPDSDVDLAALPILPFINYAHDVHHIDVYMAPFNSSLIPDESYFAGICQLDDVVMIGYPDSLRDLVNNQPIFRKGSIATNPNKPFNGRREFLVDMAVYGGSSGSPILLVDDGPHINRQTHVFENRGRIKLIGVNRATHIHTATGSINAVVHPTAKVDLIPETQIPNGLGVIIHAKRIKELEDIVLKVAGADKD